MGPHGVKVVRKLFFGLAFGGGEPGREDVLLGEPLKPAPGRGGGGGQGGTKNGHRPSFNEKFAKEHAKEEIIHHERAKAFFCLQDDMALFLQHVAINKKGSVAAMFDLHA